LEVVTGFAGRLRKVVKVGPTLIEIPLRSALARSDAKSFTTYTPYTTPSELLLLEVTGFARRLSGEYIVGMTQPMGLSRSDFVKPKSAAGVTEPRAVETPVL